MICKGLSPGLCEECGRLVRWADLQACQANGPPGTPEPSPAESCRECKHRGEPVNAADGSQVGTKGCGCTPESAPSGVLWWFCGLNGKPVRESRAMQCNEYERKEPSDAPR